MQAFEHRSLVELAMEGDADAFADLYRDHNIRVYNLAVRSTRNASDAEDICQEVWLKVHREIGRLRCPEAFPAWLRQITTRVCIDAERRRRPSAPAADMLEIAGGSGTEDAVSEREKGRIIWQALGAISPRQSAALFLREVEGYDYRRIAEAIGTSISGVEALLFRARKALARSFELLEASQSKRCRLARAVMAAVVDGEGSPVKRHSLRAHLDGCSRCRSELESMRRASRAYSALPFLPVATSPYWLASSQAAPAAPLTFGNLGLLFAKLKALTAPTLVTTSVTASLIAAPFGIHQGQLHYASSDSPAFETVEAPSRWSAFADPNSGPASSRSEQPGTPEVGADPVASPAADTLVVSQPVTPAETALPPTSQVQEIVAHLSSRISGFEFNASSTLAAEASDVLETETHVDYAEQALASAPVHVETASSAPDRKPTHALESLEDTVEAPSNPLLAIEGPADQRLAVDETAMISAPAGGDSPIPHE
ncbi:MAG: sigma-70 family RNA polymerase sigma factor [Chloroflexi bacterium]|nr:sigma-70 family RNA polymerase sigma factor [Chloroflexota bacterium]